jgi:hypothetical protein
MVSLGRALPTYTVPEPLSKMGGSQPWPQVPVGNKTHTDAAVVIIGAGISGKQNEKQIPHSHYMTETFRHVHGDRTHQTQ